MGTSAFVSPGVAIIAAVVAAMPRRPECGCCRTVPNSQDPELRHCRRCLTIFQPLEVDDLGTQLEDLIAHVMRCERRARIDDQIALSLAVERQRRSRPH
jgi:hypothetical protein